MPLKIIAPYARNGRVVSLLVLHALFSLMIVVYGRDFTFPEAWRGEIMRASAIVFSAGIIGLLVFSLRPQGWTNKPAPWMPLAALLCHVQLLPTLFFALPRPFALPAIGLAALGGAILQWTFGSLAAIAWAMAAGFTLYIGTILSVPPDTPGADMLPFIAHAIDVFRSGQSPYLADYSSIDDNPFFYPPAQWLIFLPARVAGVDLRVVNLLSAGAMVLLVEWRARSGETSLRAAVYPIMLSSLVLPMMHSGQVWPYWLTILALALCVLEERWIGAAVVAAMAIGVRQTAIIPAAVLLMALAVRQAPARTIAALAAGAATLAVTAVPFLASWEVLKAFLITNPGRALANHHGNPDNQIALSNVLNRIGLELWDSRVEAMTALLAVSLAWLAAKRSMRSVLTVAGLGYVLTVSFNPYLHRYYYVAGFLLAAIAFTAEREPAQARA
jgi:hypothetical protein